MPINMLPPILIPYLEIKQCNKITRFIYIIFLKDKQTLNIKQNVNYEYDDDDK